ncbi:hypothetical protein ACF0H5_014327 [Mactra antiquata]
MVVTSILPDPEGLGKGTDPYRGAMSPEIPKENTDSQAKFNFDPTETVIVVRRKREAGTGENSVVLKSLLKPNTQKSLLTNNLNTCRAGRIEKVRVLKRSV